MLAVHDVRLPSGDLVPGVLVNDHVLELGPERTPGIGEQLEVDGRGGQVVVGGTHPRPRSVDFDEDRFGWPDRQRGSVRDPPPQTDPLPAP